MEPEDQPLPPAYQEAIRTEVRDVLRQSGKQIAEEQGYTKRDVLQMGGFVALGALMGTGGLAAMAGPAAADSQGEIGTQADPLTTGFFAALNAGDGQQLTDWETGFNTHAATKSTAYTTDGEHFIDVDTSAAGVTITLATADTVLGHYVAIRQNGANDVTIDTEGAETIDGSSSLTLQHDQAVVTLWSDGSNWFSDQFTDTVDARTIATDELNNEVWMDSSLSSWADALEDAYSRVSAGGIIRVPPTGYNVDRTPSTTGKEVAVISSAWGQHVNSSQDPVLSFTADATAISGGNNEGWIVSGLVFDASGQAMTVPMLDLHGQSDIRNCFFDSWGSSPAINLEQASSGDKLIGTKTSGLYMANGGSDAIKAHNTSGDATQLQNITIEVNRLVGTSGSINLTASGGSGIYVGGIQGASQTSPAVKVGATGTTVFVQRIEGNVGTPAIELSGANNMAEVGYTTLAASNVFNITGGGSRGLLRHLGRWFLKNLDEGIQHESLVLDDRDSDGNKWALFDHNTNGRLNFQTLAGSTFSQAASIDTTGDYYRQGTKLLGAQSSAYSPTNVTTDRTYDADSTTTAELADVLGTLIADLQSHGLIG